MGSIGETMAAEAPCFFFFLGAMGLLVRTESGVESQERVNFEGEGTTKATLGFMPEKLLSICIYIRLITTSAKVKLLFGPS